MAVSKRTRFEVLRRDNHTCRYCGGRPPDVVLTVDHVIPQALGGVDEPTNLVTACKDCNAGKASSSPSDGLVSDVAADALRWSAAMQEAANAALAEREALLAYADTVSTAWRRGEDEDVIPRPADWLRSVEQWRAAGVPVELICDAIDSAMSNRRVVHAEVWRYACGIIWRRLTELQDDARARLGGA